MPDRQLVATIVAAYTKSTTLQIDQLVALIAAVHATLSGIETGGRSQPPKQLTPAVPVRRSVMPSKVICLDCGYESKMLKRHLNTAHGLTPDSYRERWNLKPDYPMVAPDYAARRGELARSYGFGKHRGAGRSIP